MSVSQHWSQYFTPDNREYFFNSLTNESSWTRPADFMPPPPPKREFCISKKQLNQDWAIMLTNKNHELFYNYKTKESSWDIPDEIMGLVHELLGGSVVENESDEEQESSESEQESEISEKDGQEIGEVVVPEAIVVQEPRVITKVQEIKPTKSNVQQENKLFLQLLDEKANPLSSWSLEVPNLESDSRFIKTKRAKQLFLDWCKDKSNQILNPSTSYESRFKELLQEKVLSVMRFDQFCTANSAALAKIILSEHDRVNLFNTHVGKLRDQLQKQKNREFMDLLKEKNIDKSYTWVKTRLAIESDERYLAISTLVERENLFRKYLSSL